MTPEDERRMEIMAEMAAAQAVDSRLKYLNPPVSDIEANIQLGVAKLKQGYLITVKQDGETVRYACHSPSEVREVMADTVTPDLLDRVMFETGD